jgi:hypothetical protein
VSPKKWFTNPSAIWLRAELPVQIKSTRFLLIHTSLRMHGRKMNQSTFQPPDLPFFP